MESVWIGQSLYMAIGGGTQDLAHSKQLSISLFCGLSTKNKQ